MPLLVRSCVRVRCVSYVQGQSPSPKTREYFYYIDHQGQVGLGSPRVKSVCFTMIVYDLIQLFLDDARVKNFITCFKGEV